MDVSVKLYYKQISKMCKVYCLLLTLLIIEVSAVHAGLEETEFGTQIQELVKPLHNACLGKSGTDEATITKIKNGNFVEDPKIKSYMKCLCLESTGMNDHGDINEGLIVDLLPPDMKKKGAEVLHNCVQKCKDISNLDEKAFNLFKCIYEGDPAKFIFF